MSYLDNPHFIVESPNNSVSPFTGLTRKHWIDCATYILGRAFEKYIPSVDKVMVFPPVDGKSYPQPGAPAYAYKACELEAVRRTSYLGFPLIHTDPNIKLNGIRLTDYYIRHLMRLIDPTSPGRIPFPEELEEGVTYGPTNELGAICMQLLCFPDVIWDEMTQAQRDAFAAMTTKWAHYYTHPHNWRYFTICMLSFLKLKGYPIDEQLLKTHIYHILSLHAGGGWYFDGHFDYYTIYVMATYGAIWAKAYGRQYEPEAAAVIEKSIRDLTKSYPAMFGRNGYAPMWSRSVIYRFSSIAGFPAAFLLNDSPGVEPGFARRLCSGTLLQFATRDDFYHNDVPSLGYYGHREYCIQSYSSSGSPFTMFIPYIALALDEQSPFWTAVETEGDWPALGDQPSLTDMPRPGISVLRYGRTGTSELHTAKVSHEDGNYNKICYNSHFPWEDTDFDGASAMQFNLELQVPGDDVDPLTKLKKQTGSEPAKRGMNYERHTPAKIYSIGLRDGVLYRQFIMKDDKRIGAGWIIDVAEIPVPNGVLRVDRVRLRYKYRLTSGHFGLPHIDGLAPTIKSRTINGVNAITAAIPGRQVALVNLGGWQTLGSITHKDKNAEADDSTVIFAKRAIDVYAETGIALLASLVLHKTDDAAWTDEELLPVQSLDLRPVMPSGSVYGAIVSFRTGEQYCIDYNEIDGHRSI